jgi:hypothetical protein
MIGSTLENILPPSWTKRAIKSGLIASPPFAFIVNGGGLSVKMLGYSPQDNIGV